PRADCASWARVCDWWFWDQSVWSWGHLRIRARDMRRLLRPQAAQDARQELWRCRRSLGVFAFAEGAVGDALQQAGVMLDRADMAPVHLVRMGVEMVVAERLQPCEHLVD